MYWSRIVPDTRVEVRMKGDMTSSIWLQPGGPSDYRAVTHTKINESIIKVVQALSSANATD